MSDVVASSQWNVYESFQALMQAGPYHLALEGVLVLCIVWLFTAKKKPYKNVRLSKKEEEDLLEEWTPEPLVPNPPPEDHPALHTRTIYGKVSRYIKLDTASGTGTELLNLSTHNYLNMALRQEVEEATLGCLHKFGVGSCGPRGFYGTTEVHLKLEERLAEYFNCEAAVLYSFGFSTSASAIPAYAKSGDIVYADEMVSFAVQRGLQATRSRIVYFRHNDPQHLEQLLEDQVQLDKKDPKKAAATRKFLVLEGIYINSGQLCCLPEMVKLRQKYRLRLFLDESISFGTLGPNCRGATDHFNISMQDIDLIMASLEYSAGAYGGFCVGTNFVVEHQRLSGLGYCFSASLPPMLAAASIKVVDIMEKEGPELVQQLQTKCRMLHTALETASDKIELSGDQLSPVKHIRLAEPSGERERDELTLRDIVEKAESYGVALTVACYLADREAHPPPPSIRITADKDLTPVEIQMTKDALSRAVRDVLG